MSHETIMKVIDRITPRYVFAFYDLDDIKQESYIICLEAMRNYDNIRPLENFLAKNLSNKLKTYVRAKFLSSVYQDEKKTLMEPGLEYYDNKADVYNHEHEVEMRELESLLEAKLSNKGWKMYQKFLGGVLPRAQTECLYSEIKECLKMGTE